MSISIDALKEAISIKETIERLESRLSHILGGKPVLSPVAHEPVKKGRRRMSAAARVRISAATKARWARVKSASAPAPAARKKGLSPEGRAKIVAALKARWAKVKAAKKK